MSKTYNVFISHSWKNPEDYNNLVNLLKQEPYFNFKDYSVGKEEPFHGSNQTVWNEIIEQIRYCSGVLIPAGIYATLSDSIEKELRVASNHGKKIIAIKLFGNENISSVARKYANEIVNWNTDSIVKAIKKHF